MVIVRILRVIQRIVIRISLGWLSGYQGIITKVSRDIQVIGIGDYE